MLDPVLTILLQDIQASLGHLRIIHLIYSHFKPIFIQAQLFGSVPQPILIPGSIIWIQHLDFLQQVWLFHLLRKYNRKSIFYSATIETSPNASHLISMSTEAVTSGEEST